MNRILMVEEEAETLQNAQKCLSHAGFEMISAYDGRNGFEIAKNKIPDLIIADADIPVMSGFEFCQAIKHHESTKSIPIVVVTQEHDLEEPFMVLGISDFLNKPLRMDELENIVRNKLNVYQSMQLQKTKILICGRPEILACCERLLRRDPHWTGYFSYDKGRFFHDAITCGPDVIFMDLLTPGIFTDEIILKLKSAPELKNTVILTYYSSALTPSNPFAIQAQMIEVEYMKIVTEQAGALEYLGLFNPATFLKLIDIYRKDL